MCRIVASCIVSKSILKSGELGESEAHTERYVVRKMSGSDSATDRPASVVEKETVKEALAELLAEMPGFKALMGEASTAASAAASRSHES